MWIYCLGDIIQSIEMIIQAFIKNIKLLHRLFALFFVGVLRSLALKWQYVVMQALRSHHKFFICI